MRKMMVHAYARNQVTKAEKKPNNRLVRTPLQAHDSPAPVDPSATSLSEKMSFCAPLAQP